MLLLAGATSFMLAALAARAALSTADIMLMCKPSDGSDSFSIAIWPDRRLAQIESKHLNLDAVLLQTQIFVSSIGPISTPLAHWGTIDRITGHFVLNDQTQGQNVTHQI